MKFKGIFLVAICGTALSSLMCMDHTAQNIYAREYARKHREQRGGIPPIMSNQHGLTEFMNAVENGDQDLVNAFNKHYGDYGFMQAVKTGQNLDEYDVHGYRHRILGKARAMLQQAQ